MLLHIHKTVPAVVMYCLLPSVAGAGGHAMSNIHRKSATKLGFFNQTVKVLLLIIYSAVHEVAIEP